MMLGMCRWPPQYPRRRAPGLGDLAHPGQVAAAVPRPSGPGDPADRPAATLTLQDFRGALRASGPMQLKRMKHVVWCKPVRMLMNVSHFPTFRVLFDGKI